MVVIMSKRDELYRKFGPLLLEAMVKMLIKEQNRIRARLGMPEITLQDAVDALESELNELQPYDWFEEPEP